MVRVPLTPGSAVVLFLVGIMGAALIDVFAPRDVVRAGLVSIVLHTEPTNPSNARHALLKTDEAATDPPLVQRAPRIILGFNARSDADDAPTDSQHE